MRLFDKNVLFENHDVEGAVLVHSFIEYKANGGIHDALDTYAHFKELAKKSELEYIEMKDMSLSGIPVDKKLMERKCHKAQMFWYLLWLWFNKDLNKPLRVVKYSTFSLEEFNNL